MAAVVPISTSTGSPLSVSQSCRAHASSSAAASFNRARTLAAVVPPATTPRHVARRGFGSSSGSGGDGKPEQQQQQQERDIKQPSMDVEKDVATALRGVQELHRAGKYTEVSQ